MGRTQTTYRRRLQQIRDRYMSLYRGSDKEANYKKLWTAAHTLSAPASTLPYPDTHAVATFSMVLEVIAKMQQLKDRLEN